MVDPQGQTSSGSPCAHLPNPKTNEGSGDGTQGLPAGATSAGYGPESSTRAVMSGADQNAAVINPYVSADTSGVPATRKVSANRLSEINPGSQTLGDC